MPITSRGRTACGRLTTTPVAAGSGRCSSVCGNVRCFLFRFIFYVGVRVAMLYEMFGVRPQFGDADICASSLRMHPLDVWIKTISGAHSREFRNPFIPCAPHSLRWHTICICDRSVLFLLCVRVPDVRQFDMHILCESLRVQSGWGGRMGN